LKQSARYTSKSKWQRKTGTQTESDSRKKPLERVVLEALARHEYTTTNEIAEETGLDPRTTAQVLHQNRFEKEVSTRMSSERVSS
jgi:DNA-binding MarR family transcriptional regulator